MTDPRLFDFVAQLHRDTESGALRPLADYLPRFPGLETEVEREYREHVRRAGPDVGVGECSHEASTAASTDQGPESIQQLLERLARHPSRPGRYGEKQEVGRGGMGIVQRTFDLDLRRSIAMKTVRRSNERSLAAFLDEAQITGQLDHPGIVPIHELGVDENGNVFFTMRLVKGRTLAELFERVESGDAEWTRTRALDALLRVCDAMAFAHSKGVIHRDLKPANVMCGEFGEVYVVDWGLARVLGSGARRIAAGDPSVSSLSDSVRTTRVDELASTPESPLATRDGDVVGTPCYMPPEQASGNQELLGTRSDVYSVGAILYQLLCGRAPYAQAGDRAHQAAVLLRVLAGPPPALSTVRPGIPAELVAICEKAMARDPADRYVDMSAMAHDLRAFLEQRVVSAYRVGAWQEFKKWVSRNRMSASLAGLAVLLVFGALLAAGNAVKNRELAVATNETSLLQSEPSLRADVMRSMLEDESSFHQLVAEVAAALADLSPSAAADTGLRERVGRLGRDVGVWRSYPGTLRDNARNVASRRGKSLPSRIQDGQDVQHAEQVLQLVEVLAAGESEAWSACLARARWRLERAQASRRQVLGAMFPDEGSRDDHDRLMAFIDELAEYCEPDPEIGVTPLLGSDAPAGAAHDLVPLGVDPLSGLSEFVVRGTGRAPVRGSAGRLTLDANSGLVLVRTPAAAEGGPPAFYLAKHELTLGQWMRAGHLPDRASLATWNSLSADQRRVALGSPVVDVDWDEVVVTLRRLGLQLASEEQWETAAAADRGRPGPTGSAPPRERVVSGAEGLTSLPILVLPGENQPNAWGIEGLDRLPAEWTRGSWGLGAVVGRSSTSDPRVVRGGAGPEPGGGLEARGAAARSARSRELGIRAVRPLDP